MPGRLAWLCAGAVLVAAGALAGPASATAPPRLNCSLNAANCAEPLDSIGYEGAYIGHDEPSVLFYDDRPGSGSSMTYRITLPKDPAVQPTQDGTGTTWTFQERPTFWLGVDMCDTESAPEFTHSCPAASDANIFDSPDPAAPDFIGHHPGGAFTEVQFYPPGWLPFTIGPSCDPTRWCAALTIDSFSEDQNRNVFNNADCREKVGDEPVNFAFVTNDGRSEHPADPLFPDPDAQLTPDPDKTFWMNPGDHLTVSLFDTRHGLQVVIHDRDTGTVGTMTASRDNGFRQVVFQPHAKTCRSRPYNFHPMYATSSEHTRLTWTAHGYNVAYSDEIGHFEYCNDVTKDFGCAGDPSDPASPDDDDFPCFGPEFSLLVKVGGCEGSDVDFDGVSYQPEAWPGTAATAENRRSAPTPVLFTSATFDGPQPAAHGSGTNYARTAIEVDLPRIEPGCDRFVTGNGCTRMPEGANFYPIFTLGMDRGHCVWQEGGPLLPGTVNDLGGSVDQFGELLQLFYPAPGGIITRLNDFRHVFDTNPCPY